MDDVFIARCLAELPSYAAGVRHQATCPECVWLDAVERAEATVRFDDDWYEDSPNIAALLRWLRDSDEGLDLARAIEIVAEPWKWKPEYRRMLAEQQVGPKP